ncbi:hypothetical protein JTE90_022228, partial [Oedothorax gibbosus]
LKISQNVHIFGPNKSADI